MKRSFMAHNIDWDVDMSEIFDKLDEMTCEKAAEILEIPENRYANMTTDERHDYAYDFFRRRPGAVADFMNLPVEITIPDKFKITSTQDDMSLVTDWMADAYGFCINNYEVKEMSNDEQVKALAVDILSRYATEPYRISETGVIEMPIQETVHVYDSYLAVIKDWAGYVINVVADNKSAYDKWQMDLIKNIIGSKLFDEIENECRAIARNEVYYEV